MKYRRLLAYIIDVGIVIILLSLLNMVFTNPYKEDLNNLNRSLTNYEISYAEYMSEYMIVTHNIDKNDIWFNVIGIIVMLINFTIIPFFSRGQTLGKKIFKIRIRKIKGELEIDDLIKRSIIINGMGYMLMVVLLVYILPSIAYFYTIIIISIIQVLLIIVSGLRIIKRKKGIHDILANTEVCIKK